MAPRESPRKPRERSHHHDKKRSARKSKYESSSSGASTQVLSVNALAKLDRLNQNQPVREAEVTPTKPWRKRHREVVDEKIVVEKRRQHKRKKRRVVSGALLEEGDGARLRGLRGGARYEKDEDSDGGGGGGGSKRKCLIYFSGECGFPN